MKFLPGDKILFKGGDKREEGRTDKIIYEIHIGFQVIPLLRKYFISE